MNNILTFEDYKKMNIRKVESVIYRQFVEEDIKKEDEVNEGFIRNFINKQSSKFIQAALGDEIEKGKELEKSIKEALDGLNKGFEEVEKNIDANSEVKPNMDAIEKVKEAIKAVQSQAFDTLTMIGSEGEIDFAGFMGSASVAAAANFGILFSPIRSVFMTRKAYKYFLGIIKQTIRRNLLVIQLNFDQFENLILQKSFENEDSEAITRREATQEAINTMSGYLFGPNKKGDVITGTKNIKRIKEAFDAYLKMQKANNEYMKSSPFSSLWQDQYNNTYTKTLEQIKQYINDDSQKELDALKNSITKMAGNDTELAQYGELLISAAEEYAIKTNHGINNNFIKMSSVFNLENQKKLIDLIVETQKENEAEIKKKENTELEDRVKEDAKDGKDIYEKKLKGHEGDFDTLDALENEFGDSIYNLKAFFKTEEGSEIYKELIENYPIYKYFIEDIMELSSFLNNIDNLKIIEISSIKDFDEHIVKKEQAFYNIMSERSIKNAVKSQTPKTEKYFGFDSIKDSDVDGSILKYEDSDINKKINNELRYLFTKRIKPSTGKGKEVDVKRYFLTFNGDGSGLFNIIHNDFKTKIFKDSGEYEDKISTESKETILKLIHKNLKIGNDIITPFAEYLVRLEAHMLLTKQKPWFVVKDNGELSKCFKPDAKEIQNENAFVEISQEDYESIKEFLTKYHALSKNDFSLDENTEEKKK